LLAAILAISLALPPSGARSRLELDASALFDGRTLDSSPTGWFAGGFAPGGINPRAPGIYNGQWLGGGGSLGLTVFLHSVVDDDAAPSLQPFLQRSGSFHLGGGGSGASVDYPVSFASSGQAVLTHRTLGGGSVNLFAEGYYKGWLYLGTSIRADYTTWHDYVTASPTSQYAVDQSELIVPLSAEAGIRWHDLRVAAGWGVAPYRLGSAAMQVRFWGGAFASLYTVIHRWVGLGADVRVLDGGAFVDASASFWVRRRLGIVAGVAGGHGGFVDSPRSFDSVGGSAGIECWFQPRWALSLTYAPNWQQREDGYSMVQHLVTLTILSRPY
jgi:hypothetical protein